MHPKYQQAARITGDVIGAAIEVHKELGAGLMESVYEWALVKELELRSLQASNQKAVRIRYKDFIREESLKFDILVEDCLLIELKAVEKILPIHKAQLLSYMKLLR